jgi:hypothetical protein
MCKPVARLKVKEEYHKSNIPFTFLSLKIQIKWSIAFSPLQSAFIQTMADSIRTDPLKSAPELITHFRMIPPKQ